VTGHGVLRFVFYGRVSTEDWQDPVTSRARQREQAGALVRGHGMIVAEFFDAGQSRTVAWGRRPQALRWSPGWRTRAGAGTRS
jgi:DNA invertase Pin-like site-specific DNA recombinase